MQSRLEIADFDRYLTDSEKQVRTAAQESNDAFTAAMTKAIKRGCEKVKPGTYVDLTPPIGAVKWRGILPLSVCGSPAAMCMEAGGAHSGAETMK